jgi:Putative member of DMT superfamily (DUF486)
LKTIQEVITLVVFCVFSVLYLKEPLNWNYLAGFGLMVGAVFLIFKEVNGKRELATHSSCSRTPHAMGNQLPLEWKCGETGI